MKLKIYQPDDQPRVQGLKDTVYRYLIKRLSRVHPFTIQGLVQPHHYSIKELRDCENQSSIQGLTDLSAVIKGLNQPDMTFKLHYPPIQFKLYEGTTATHQNSFRNAQLLVYKKQTRYDIGTEVWLKKEPNKKGIVTSRILNSYPNSSDFYYIQWHNTNVSILHSDDELGRSRYIPPSYYQFQKRLADSKNPKQQN